jgi:c-di-GMP-binding flagellar brake protein YcgR
MAKTKKDAPPHGIAELSQGDADDVTRRSFRGMVGETEHITLEIAGRRHPVVDIGSHGLGILLADGNALAPGQSHELTLALGSRTFRLKGVVRHVTRDDEAGAFHCGIQLLDLDDQAETELQAFVLRQRHHLFGRTAR